MAETGRSANEEQLAALMNEAQVILTKQDPRAISSGQFTWYTVPLGGIQSVRPNPLSEMCISCCEGLGFS